MPDERRERWKGVVGYEGLYQVSSLGRVRSLDRIVTTEKSRRKFRSVILKLLPNSHGYPQVTLSEKGQTKTWQVHQLVAAAFIGVCPTGLECCHGDGDSWNNRPGNLRYDTRRANHADKRRHGTHLEGSSHPRSKLREIDVVKLRDAYATTSTSIHLLAAKYGVSYITVHRILSRERWKHVGGKDCSHKFKLRKSVRSR